jgi:hypothetical protein
VAAGPHSEERRSGLLQVVDAVRRAGFTQDMPSPYLRIFRAS